MKNSGKIVLMMVPAVFAYAAAAPQNAPMPAATAPSSAPAYTVQYGSVPGLESLADRFAIQFVGAPLPAWANVDTRDAKTVDAAIGRLREALAHPPSAAKAKPFDVKEFVIKGDTRVFEIIDPDSPRKPLYCGKDPTKIPDDDSLMTAIIPLEHIDAVRLRPAGGNEGDAEPAKAGGNLLVPTGSSRQIRRVVDIVARLDVAPQPISIIQYRQLQNANAADAAKAINAMFAPANITGPASQAASTTQASPPAPIQNRLYADSDTRTNTVVLNGPPDLVKNALLILDQIDTLPPATQGEKLP